VVLVDFGVARSAESPALTGAKEVVGTALYIAPEQVSKQTTGPCADIYALGAVAYHCLAGHPPFLGDNPITVALQHVRDEPPPLPGDVPPAVRTLVATALAKDPADRFTSAAAMAEAAEHAMTGSGETTAILATSARRASPGSGTAVLPALPDDDGRRRSRTPLIVAGAILVLLVAGVVLALANPGGLLPGSTPPATSQNGGPSQNQSPTVATTTKRGTSTTQAPAGNDPQTTAPGRTTTPTPSHSPTETGTTATTAPEQTATTEPADTETTTGTDNSGPGGGGDDNSGNGGGGGGDEDNEAAATPTP
jgi:serine/threonine-protein kinase